MTVDQTANFVRGLVSASVGSTDTSISVNDASIYPDPANGNYNLVLWDADEYRRPDLDPDVEIVRATSIDFTNNVISVSRSQEGTTAVSHPSTAELQLAPTSKVFTDIDSKITSSISVTGNNGLSGGSANLGGSLSVGISGTLSLDSDLEAADGETIWDESQTYIPTARLENESMTIAGNAVSLGGSTSINHSNISNIFSDDHHSKTSSASELTDVSADSVSDAHHSKYTDSNAISAVNGSTLSSGLTLNGGLSMGSNNVYFQPSSSGGSVTALTFESNTNAGSDFGYIEYHDDYFGDGSGESSALVLRTENDAPSDRVVLDGAGGTYVENGPFDLASNDFEDSGTTIWDTSASYIPQGRLQNDTVTIEGNSVSLGGSTSVNHNDLSSISSDDHHSKYTDENAQDAVGTIISGSTDISVTYDDGANSITVDHDNTSNQGNVSTGGATVIDDIDLDGRGHVTNLNTQNRSLDDWQSSVDDNTVGFGSNTDFSIFYESASDELVIRDETNSVDLIRQPKAGSTQFIQGADIGSIEAPEDSFTQTINAAATSASTSGDKIGYTLAIDNQTAFEVSGTSDGSGGLSDPPQVFVPNLFTANNGIEVTGGPIDQYATIRASSNAENGHLMVDANGGNVYLARDGGDTRINNGKLETSLNANDQLIYNVDSLRDNAANCELVFDSSNNRFEFEDGSGNRTEGLFSRIYLDNNSQWFEGNHSSLSGISSNDHHSKTSSASELTDVSADSVSDAHHSKYADTDAVNAIETNNLLSISFTDSSSDGNNWQLTEDGTNGHLNFISSGGGGTQMDLEHNGNLRLEGEVTEGAAL